MATNSIRTYQLSGGDCIILPDDAEIEAIIIDGAVSVTSECGQLPTPSEYVCYRFSWEDDESGSMQDAIIHSLIIGANSYVIPSPNNQYNQTGNTIHQWIGSTTVFNGLVKQGCETTSPYPILKIKVPDGLGVPKLKVINYGPEDYTSYIEGVIDSDCSSC